MSQESNFICSHVVDRSMLSQGISFRKAMLGDLTAWFGALKPGETRSLTLRVDGEDHKVRIGNRNFDRQKWPTHAEQYQIRYNPMSSFARALRNKFTTTQQFISTYLMQEGPDFGKKHIPIPLDQQEQIIFYRTDDPLVWEVDVVTAEETVSAAKQLDVMDESRFESQEWQDENAGIVLRPALAKVRQLDRSIGKNLKLVYQHRCQVCGEQVAIRYDTFVDEVHHLEPFVTSLNNDVSNLIVLCPTHHRIVHATNAVFSHRAKAFSYPNGLVEKLKLNMHL